MAAPVRLRPRVAGSPNPAGLPAQARKDAHALIIKTSTGSKDATQPHAMLMTEPAQATIISRPKSPTADRTSTDSSQEPNCAPHLKSMISSNDHVKNWAQRAAIADRAAAVSSTNILSSKAVSSLQANERSFYRRLLFQNLPLSEEAPSITSDPELDHEIYLLLSYLLRETVLPWYGKLTPDKELLTEVTKIIVSIFRVIVLRISSPGAIKDNTTDLARLHIFASRDLSRLLRQHFIDFRASLDKVGSVWAPLASKSMPDLHSTSSTETWLGPEIDHLLTMEAQVYPELLAQLYHSVSPHPGIDLTTGALDGKVDLQYLRIAALSLIGSLLPADDFAPDTERFIVRDVLVTVVRGVLAKPTRPWFITQSLHKLLDAVGCKETLTKPAEGEIPAPSSGSFGFVTATAMQGLVIALRMWTFAVFTVLPVFVRTYYDLFNVATIRKQRQSTRAPLYTASPIPRSWSVGSMTEKRMHGRFPSEPVLNHESIQRDLGTDLPIQSKAERALDDDVAESKQAAPTHYVAEYIRLAEEIFETRSSALLSSSFGFISVGLRATRLDRRIDHIFTSLINSKVRDTKQLAEIIKTFREILLPGGHLPPAAEDPSGATQEEDWIRLRARVVQGVPPFLRKAILGPDSVTQFDTVTRWLSPLCAPQAAGPNTLLGILLFERLIVMLCPDLVES